MKNIIIFLLLLISVIAMWYLSIVLFTDYVNIFNFVQLTQYTLATVNSLFLALSLMAISFAIIIFSLKTKSNQYNIDRSIQTTSMHLEIIALSSLINECDVTLHRYDRWEEAGIKGDYMNAKTSVRDKMNMYREKLESLYEDIQLLNE